MSDMPTRCHVIGVRRAFLAIAALIILWNLLLCPSVSFQTEMVSLVPVSQTFHASNVSHIYLPKVRLNEESWINVMLML